MSASGPSLTIKSSSELTDVKRHDKMKAGPSRLTPRHFPVRARPRKGKIMRGFSHGITGFSVAGLARGHDRLFTAKTAASKTTKTV
jgi:hypothetical protein